jgi:hypothetical protein
MIDMIVHDIVVHAPTGETITKWGLRACKLAAHG